MSLLDKQRLIEAQRVSHLCDLPRRGAFPKHLLNGIARNDMNQKKDHVDILPAINGEDSYGASLVFAKSLRRVPGPSALLRYSYLPRRYFRAVRP
jgi:hypothetical protein